MNPNTWPPEKMAHAEALLAAGHTQRQVAGMLGCSESSLSHRLRRTRESDTLGPRIYAMRMDGMEFPAIADALGQERSPTTTRRLYMRLVRYCERVGVAYPRVVAAKTATDSSGHDEMTLFRVSFFIRRRAGRGQASTNTDVAYALGLSERDVKLYTAELRRRGVLANGIVPTGRGIIEAQRRSGGEASYDQVLRAVVAAWTSGAPCETLSSLLQKLHYNRSTVNLAIVRLRDEGFVAPRGNLYPRARRHE